MANLQSGAQSSDKAFRNWGGRSLSHYQEVFGFNDDACIQIQWGPFEYTGKIGCDAETGETVAASFFGTMVFPKKLRDRYGYHGSIIADYLFVEERERGKGTAARLMEERFAHAKDFLVSAGVIRPSGKARFLICNEVEDSLSLKPQEFIDTMKRAKISPLRREIHWYNAGFRSFGYPYIETEAADGSPECRHYKHNALVGSRPIWIESELLAYHTMVHAAICRQRGKNPHHNASYREMYAAIMSQPGHIPEDRRTLLRSVEPKVIELLQRPIPPDKVGLSIGEIIAPYAIAA